ncbi:MAG: dUTPase [Clostridiales bacterium]|jgi:dimeric dUTPase (all-alpha-NTP-PPase superfamily)|nr:dUTPase [Clostridiales bacterium]HOB64051.1 dUTPase [Clostridia bacterium]HOK81242.1 dUTPase [Clostridia bacterium]HOL60361.1 dUTPase [Clostridia bacterium]HPO53118.1 dUTPase [Clostridia bacterium]
MEQKPDMLQVIFDLQRKFDTEIVEKRNLKGISPDEWIQKEVLAMLSELAELLAEVNFKWWKNPKEINYENIKGELIDILHFFASMCIKIGMDAPEVYERYIEKNKENFLRQYGKSSKTGYELDKLENKA